MINEQDVKAYFTEVDAIANGYFKENLPSKSDEAVSKLVGIFKGSDDATKRNIIDECNKNRRRSSVILCYMERMANLAVREKNKAYLINALTAMAIENFNQEDKEFFIIMPLIAYSAQKIGHDPKTLFIEAAKYAVGESVKYLDYSKSKYEPDVNIRQSLYEESETPDGLFVYKNLRRRVKD